MFTLYGANLQTDPEDGISAADYLAAAVELVAMCNVMNSGNVNLPLDRSMALLNHWKRFMSLTEDCPDLVQPKRHAISHMIVQSRFFGNPKAYACWFDEALNKVLKNCCRLRSPATFDEAVLSSMPFLIACKVNRKSLY
jgi:hypothetical protein